jgi:hypothetical protein
MRKAACIFLILLLAGCAFHRTPFATYEGNLPLANTAVFAAFDYKSEGALINIPFVDGKEMPKFDAGYPYWVRVLPGRHTFTVRYNWDYGLSVGTVTWKTVDLPIEIPEMMPLHVYAARYTRRGNRVSVSIEDIGERPNFGIILGRKGVNQHLYPVEF